MTIKRRIFISNMLMILIPFVLCSVFSAAAGFAILKSRRGRDGQFFNSEIFYEARRELANIGNMAEYSGIAGRDELRDSVENLGDRFRDYAVFFGLYDGGEWVIPPPRNIDPLFDALLAADGNHTLSFDGTLVYAQSIGTSKAMAINYDFHFNDGMYARNVLYAGIAALWLLIMLILGTNFLLTRGLINNLALKGEVVVLERWLHSGV